MTLAEQTMSSVSDSGKGRREFLRGTAAAAAGIGALMALTESAAQADDDDGDGHGLRKADLEDTHCR
jgi:hypothetical protein